jgi:hypothetical protein
LDITRSNQYHVLAQLDTVKPHFIESAINNNAELYALWQFQPAAE